MQREGMRGQSPTLSTAAGRPARSYVGNAAAKINLSLEVTGRRADGYHELVSVMQQVSVYDTLEVSLQAGLSLACSDARLAGTDNLILRAAGLLRDRFQVKSGCGFTLTKRIPVAAGLAGGSADAALALRLLTRLWELSPSEGDLGALAARIGSDVPFCLHGGTALVEGRGELVTPLPQPPPVWFLLVNPGITVSTRAVFDALPSSEWSDGARTRSLASAMEAGAWAGFGTNTLAGPLFALSPEAHDCYLLVERLAPGRTIVSGSGPTVVAWLSDQEAAVGVQQALQSTGYWSAIASPVPAWTEAA